MNCAKALAGGLLFAILLSSGEAAASSHGYQFPLDLATCTYKQKPCVFLQDYGYFGSYEKAKDKYHAGVDIAAEHGTSVHPVAKGTVILIQKDGQGCWTTIKGACKDQDDEPEEPTETDKSRAPTVYYYKLHSDHGFGNTIVLRHPELDVYSQYSHLAEVPDRKLLGATVNPVGQNEKVGQVGQSGAAEGPHLHFEIKKKNFPGLRNKDKETTECGWGYTSVHPDRCDYEDPVTFRELDLNSSTLIFPPINVRVTPLGTQEKAVSIRWLPGDSIFIRPVTRNEEFVAIREFRDDLESKGAESNCSEGWYQILPTEGKIFSYKREVKTEDIKEEDVILEKAWICRGDGEEIWVKEEEPRPKPKQRVGLATALVIDRSGSMKGKKLANAKEGAKAYIQHLSPDDFAAISSFSERASTELKMNRYAYVKENIDRVLSQIEATSATNIGAGLEHGYAQLDKASAATRKIGLLLSDGKNNRGDWRPIVAKFKARNRKIDTVGYGDDRDEATLREIARLTGGTYWPPGIATVVNHYQQISANAKGESVLLSVSDLLAPAGELKHLAQVSSGAENLTAFTSWQGSKLETVLVSPGGRTIRKEHLSGSRGRYTEGRIYQILQVNNPRAGKWQISVRWAEPPAVAEQVNLSVAEKSDIFAHILGFRPEYAQGQPVNINVQVAEVVGDRKVALIDPSIRVRVQKPGGPKMVRLVRKRLINLRSAKRTVQSTTRTVRLYDDGAHEDYNAGDGIFGGTFTETGENGAYLVTATVIGHKRNGQRVQRKLIASFQVGPISQNPVTTAQVIEYLDLLGSRTDPAEAIERLRSDPLDAIKSLQSGPSEDTKHLPQLVK